MTTANTWFGSGITGSSIGLGSVGWAVRSADQVFQSATVVETPYATTLSTAQHGPGRAIAIGNRMLIHDADAVRVARASLAQRPSWDFLSFFPRLRTVALLGGVLGAASAIYLAYTSSTEPPTLKELLWAAVNGGVSGALGGVASVGAAIVAGGIMGATPLGKVTVGVASMIGGFLFGSKSSQLLDQAKDYFSV